jgi:hypothetical protein
VAFVMDRYNIKRKKAAKIITHTQVFDAIFIK